MYITVQAEQKISKAGHKNNAGLRDRFIGFAHGLWLQIAPTVPMSALGLRDTGLPDTAGCLQRHPEHRHASAYVRNQDCYAKSECMS